MTSGTPRLWVPRGPGQCEGLTGAGDDHQCGQYGTVGLPEAPYCHLHIPDALRPLARDRVALWNERAPALWAAVLAERPGPATSHDA